MSAPDAVLELVERFERNLEAYRRRLQRDPGAPRVHRPSLRGARLGRRQQAAATPRPTRTSIHEDAIKVGGDTKAPDYCFRIGGTRKFFVEAKKPAVNIKDDTGAGLPATPLRLVGQAAASDPHRLRGVRRLRLPCKPGKTDKARRRGSLYLHLRATTANAGTRSPAFRQGGRSSRAPSTSTPSRPRARRARLRSMPLS